jgi:hypothetical protein
MVKTITFAGIQNIEAIMKKVISILALSACWFLSGCSQSNQTADTLQDAAAIEFETVQHDFGTILQGGNGTFEFVFKNTGKEPLILKNVRSSCGCTIPQWPREPVNKGEKGVIKVIYNTRITGNFSKSISVYSNAGSAPVVLKIRGKVEEAAK